MMYCLIILVDFDSLFLTWISEFSDSVHQTISLTLVSVQGLEMLHKEQVG